MKKNLFLICGVFAFQMALSVTPGIADYSRYAAMLKGKKVGIVANQTSVLKGDTPTSSSRRNRSFQVVGEEYIHSVDFLYRENGVNIVRIFCPEHGFRGEADAGEAVGDYTDKATDLPVISLYGKKKKPSTEDLQGLEVMIFDIQDVGVRFYTYLSTLHYVMEACAEHRIPLIVTDRPNPNAFYIDGPVLERSYQSFVGMHPVPIVYGMTIGEYARMINGEGWLKNGIKCQLTVIACRDWDREEVVNLPRKPSPNLPDKVSVLLYPSVCLFEGTVVNEGRGTVTPFQVFGHPQLENMPYAYTPVSIPGMSKAPKCLGQKCYGVDLRGKYDEVKAGKALRLDWLLLAYRHYTGSAPFFTPFFDRLAGTDRLRKDILAGKEVQQIRIAWQPQLEKFKQVREKYLIY